MLEVSVGDLCCAERLFRRCRTHFIQNQVQELEQQNRSPDILVNLTNDAWFRGSSILDHHLNNAILVAVEKSETGADCRQLRNHRVD